MKHFLECRGLKGLVFSFIACLFFLAIYLGNLFTPVDNIIMDHLIQHEGSVNKDIRIIGIDDKTLKELGSINSSYRMHYANLIKKLNDNDHKPIAIGFDILFSGEGDNHLYDEMLINEARNSGNVVVGMNLLFSKKFHNDSVEGDIEVSLPYEGLYEATDSGYVNTSLDKSDSYVRRVIPKIDNYESFSYTMYEKYARAKGISINEYDNNKYYRFKYSSKPNGMYSVISLTDILHDRIPLDDFKDSLVLVGAYATGLSDDFLTPIKRGSKMNGVEIHANLIDAYLNDYLYSDINYYLNLFLSLLIIFIASYLIYSSRIIFSSITSATSIAIVLIVEYIALLFKLYWPLNLVVAFIVAIYVYEIAYSYFKERQLKLKTINAFKKYVAPEVVDKAIGNGEFKISLGGEKRMVACLFVDIRGFTSMSEAMAPEEVVSILNSYLSLVTDAIFKNGGTLDKFIGDAAMALFNAPFDLDDYVFRAVKCAIDIKSKSEELDLECMRRFNRSVGFGIGINLGEAVVGNIGSDVRMDYTAIGDTINTASRLEGSAKRGEIIVSEEIYKKLLDRVNFNYIGELSLKGKKEGFKAYSVISIKED